jgi:hypothetical protein
MSLNLIKSANQQRKETALKEEQERRIANQITQEMVNIKLSLLQITKDVEKAKTAWGIIKHLDFPKITVYANALFVCLNNDEMPTIEKLDVIVEYLMKE